MKRPGRAERPECQQAAARLALAHARRAARVLARLPREAAGHDFLTVRLALAVVLDELAELAARPAGDARQEGPR